MSNICTCCGYDHGCSDAIRIAELEQAGHATLLREVEKDKRIAELEAESFNYKSEMERAHIEIANKAFELAEAQKDAERFKALQNMDPKKAQTFFWNYTSRKQRAKAIDAAMESEK